MRTPPQTGVEAKVEGSTHRAKSSFNGQLPLNQLPKLNVEALKIEMTEFFQHPHYVFGRGVSSNSEPFLPMFECVVSLVE